MRTLNQDLLAFYELGQFVLKADPHGIDAATGRRARGSFAALLQKKHSNRNELTKARKFARLYSRKQLNWLCALGQKAGQPLTKSHISRIVVISKAEMRDRLAQRCARYAWSVRRLEREIQAHQPKREYGGRKPQQPSNHRELLLQTEQMAAAWIRWMKTVQRTKPAPPPRDSAFKRQSAGITREMDKLLKLARKQLVKTRRA
jgi:hypothetical protein